MTNVAVVADRLGTQVASESPVGRLVMGYINSGAKAAQNDTWTVSNAASVEWAVVKLDADGVADPVTIATNVITLTSAGTGASSGFVLYRER